MEILALMLIRAALFILHAYILVKASAFIWVQISALVVPAAKAVNTAVRSWPAYLVCSALVYLVANLKKILLVTIIIVAAWLFTDGFTTYRSIFIWVFALAYAAKIFFKNSLTTRYMDPDEVEVAIYLLGSEGSQECV